MMKKKQIIPSILTLALFSFQTNFYSYANQTISDNSGQFTATPSVADKLTHTEKETIHIVAFDPNDKTTAYNDFFLSPVPSGGTITQKPSNPVRQGYQFKGWFHSLDENMQPVFWDFTSDTVEHNITLWAYWEKVCLVAFDPADGAAGYESFYKATVLPGGLITSLPPAPHRDGYLFKGWYGYLDEELNPVFWDFGSDTVEDNTTLWAYWEKACIVTFDPNDETTKADEFLKVTVPTGKQISSVPQPPTRDGFIFIGWFLDSDDQTTVLWNFHSDTVEHDITLRAAWEKSKEQENKGGSSSTSRPSIPPKEDQVNIEQNLPLGKAPEEVQQHLPETTTETEPVRSTQWDFMPKTGNANILKYGISMSLSLLLLPASLIKKKKNP
ncbi:InlB B-repeat-containing protein [Clostridium sp. HBUAS56010]|uniref:InlB B-repeat-containing protein n=1 Tax=Clostridium sp. HBUAS56010 TaxID=2571127 RepID=UPI001A9ABC22|nr:InlB B-repeat-containing protein [Clostridium sp. HBUAS56010]